MSIRSADSVALATHRGAIRRARLGALLRASGDALGVPARASLAVRLTDDEELRSLNARFLGTDAPTDVLAFPAAEAGRVGDLAISVERAVDQDRESGGDGAAELRLLAVHGLLHCLGHDHAEASDAASMTEATRALLAGQPVPDLVPAR
ncbi:MAG: rRNA maturation RNase YbeY [Candidatus Dormibacteraeota bacterium]|uniref:Endoribonuclease YbeY n=1 Tax=Candidatus Aeolococcus gillhamiae TaxID=3127015 RepID=A0A934NB85_9BACT|nr:rRNA maturation RNase YbeY [Candidatus Dormibacteraeota bacterium]